MPPTPGAPPQRPLPRMAASEADPWEANPFRRFFLFCALATLFIRLSVLPEVIAYLTNVNTYLLYFVAPPALVGVVLMGGIRRIFRSKASLLWMAFFAWMVIATPFSSWRGGSTQRVLDYARVDLIFLLIAGGLVITWKDVKATFYTIAGAAVMNLMIANLFLDDSHGRLTLTASGTIGNSNDLAAHLLLVLPFLFFVAMGRRPLVVRIAVLGLMVYGLWIMLGTASRGALVALFGVLVCVLVRASPPQRIMALLLTFLLAAASVAILPGRSAERLSALFGQSDKEADESAASRWYLFKKSVQYTIQHPIFGVGPDQFGNYEGKASLAEGQHGAWHATHCVLTQVSAECGIPALLFFAAALGTAFRLVIRQYLRARREGYAEIANACFCYLIAMVGYLSALLFLANAYAFTLPMMIGLGIALSFAAARQMRKAPAAAPAWRRAQAPMASAPLRA